MDVCPRFFGLNNANTGRGTATMTVLGRNPCIEVSQTTTTGRRFLGG